MNNSIRSDDQNYLKALSVLYVEDEPDTREQLTAFLERRVAKVHTAVNGQDGLNQFSQYQPDLVITDIRMPVMDGLEMARHIRAMNPAIPLVITTAFEESRFFLQAIDLGVDKYVIKPVNLDCLDAVLLKTARGIRSEAAMREVEQRYRLLFRFSPVAISLSDTKNFTAEGLTALAIDWRILDCNDAFLALLGYESRDELKLVLFCDLLTPESLNLTNQLIHEELLVRDFSRECECEIRHKNGALIPVIIQFIMRRDANGVAMEAWAMMRDISEQRHSEQSLRLAKLVFERCGEAILITDGDNRIISANQGVSRITGYSQEEIIGQEPSILKSGKHDQRFYQQLWESLLSAGYWQGEIFNRRKNAEVYPEWLSITVVRDSHDEVVNYIAIFSDISEIKAAAQQIEFLAHYDPLTQLANRFQLEAQMQHLLSSASRNKILFALMFLDLDRFKIINDSLGHSSGDAVLLTVADRLKNTLRDVDIVARLGGDEFVIVLPNLKEVSDAMFVARKLEEVVRKPMQIAGQMLTITASIGISVYPENGEDYETLLKNADTAMYNAKRSGRDNFLFFSNHMNTDAKEQLTMDAALRCALKNQEFELHYQPQFAIKSGRITGIEALLRLNSSMLGNVPPGQFIPLAEESGLIIPIGEWVLREACRQNNEWQQEGLLCLPVAINLSAVQFRQINLLEVVRSALQDSALSPDYLEIELTESIIMQNAESTIDCLRNLKEIGIKLSIDDFGTGYSSLCYLKRFRIDKLKIDQSFIRDIPNDIEDEAIVKAIISLGHALNLEVIAEGVETQAQASFLVTHLCDQAQGYWYSKPLPAAGITELLKNLTTKDKLA